MGMTYYTWDPVSQNVVAESDENGATIATYTHRPELHGQLISQRRNGETRYHHYDGQGNTRQLTDESGNVTDTATYTAFGETVAKTGSTTNPFGFKGALGYYANPETNDFYVRTRTYEPAMGRWLSVDPIALGGNGYAVPVTVLRYSQASRDPEIIIKGSTGYIDKECEGPCIVFRLNAAEDDIRGPAANICACKKNGKGKKLCKEADATNYVCRTCVCLFPFPNYGYFPGKCKHIDRCLIMHESRHSPCICPCRDKKGKPTEDYCVSGPKQTGKKPDEAVKEECRLKLLDIACLRAAMGRETDQNCRKVAQDIIKDITGYRQKRCAEKSKKNVPKKDMCP